MADTFSTSIKARRIEQAAYSASGYADPLNEGVVDVLDAVASGTITIDIGSDTTYLMAPMQNGVVSESHYKRIVFIGTPASAVTIIVPDSVDVFKEYVADNQTGQLIVIKYDSTPGVRIPNGVAVLIQADGEYVEQYEIGNAVTDAEVSAAAPLLDPVYTPANPWRYGSDGEDGAADDAATQAVTNVLAEAAGLDAWKNGISVPGYPFTQGEADLGVLPSEVFYTYRVSPLIDPRRWCTRDWDNYGVQTSGLNIAILKAKADRGSVQLPNGFYARSGQLAYTLPGNQFTQGIRIVGAGAAAAVIQQLEANTPLFVFIGATPLADPSDSNLILEGFRVAGITGSSVAGIHIKSLANWTLRGMLVDSFSSNYLLESALIGLIDDCRGAHAGGYGLIMLRAGPSASGCNRVTVQNSRFILNKVQGGYFASGTDVVVFGCQFEANGDSLNPTTTGNIRVVSTFGGEIGAGVLDFISCRTEGALGENFLIDSNPYVIVKVDGGFYLAGSGSTRIIKDNGCGKLIVRGIETGTGESVASAAGSFTCEHNVIGDVIYTGPRPFFSDVTTGTTQHISDYTDAFDVTPTGVASATPVNCVVFKRGNRVTIIFPRTQWVSNSTSFGAGTVPAAYRPASGSRTFDCSFFDNGGYVSRSASVDSTGAITFDGTWTSSGAKGFTGAECGSFYL